jgi:hypothetical protein
VGIGVVQAAKVMAATSDASNRPGRDIRQWHTFIGES